MAKDKIQKIGRKVIAKGNVSCDSRNFNFNVSSTGRVYDGRLEHELRLKYGKNEVGNLSFLTAYDAVISDFKEFSPILWGGNPIHHFFETFFQFIELPQNKERLSIGDAIPQNNTYLCRILMEYGFMPLTDSLESTFDPLKLDVPYSLSRGSLSQYFSKRDSNKELFDVIFE